MDVLTFDDSGCVTARHGVGAGQSAFAYETPQRTWHTIVPGSAGGAFFEVKEGPYDPATANEFAPWSPAEGDAGAARFLDLGAQRPDRRPGTGLTPCLARTCRASTCQGRRRA